MPKSLNCRVLSAGYTESRSITFDPVAEWGKDPAILEFCRSALFITEPVVLEWQYTEAEENLKNDMDQN